MGERPPFDWHRPIGPSEAQKARDAERMSQLAVEAMKRQVKAMLTDTTPATPCTGQGPVMEHERWEREWFRLTLLMWSHEGLRCMGSCVGYATPYHAHLPGGGYFRWPYGGR